MNCVEAECLLYANIEEANKFADLAWVVKDVTALKEYKNGSLAKNGLPDGFMDVSK